GTGFRASGGGMRTKPNFGLLCIFCLHLGALGAAAAQFLDGRADGALQADFETVEIEELLLVDGVAVCDQGHPAVSVKGSILLAAAAVEILVLVLEVGNFHAEEAQLAPGGHGELADEEFLSRGGRLVLRLE